MNRINMGQQIKHTVALHHGMTRCHPNIVPGLDRQRGIHFKMSINQDHVAHFASFHVVHA